MSLKDYMKTSTMLQKSIENKTGTSKSSLGTRILEENPKETYVSDLPSKSKPIHNIDTNFDKQTPEKKKKFYLSFSKIVKWLKCPRLYYEEVILKNRPEMTHYMLMGTVVHGTIERFYDFKLKEDGINIKNYKEKFEQRVKDIFEEVWTEQKCDEEIPKYLAEGHTLESVKSEALRECELYVERRIKKLDAYLTHSKNLSDAMKYWKIELSELEIIVDDIYICYIDQVCDINKEIVLMDMYDDGMFNNMLGIVDLKTSKEQKGVNLGQKFGNGYSTKHFVEYMLQGLMYMWAYYRKTGNLVDYVEIDYMKYGDDPFKYPLSEFEKYGGIDRMKVVEVFDEMMPILYEKLQSMNPDDYTKNHDNSFFYKMCNDAGLRIDNSWCSNSLSMWPGRGYCHVSRTCDSEIEDGLL